ncbi:MAG: glycoside-pentoside-hexuronide (GPH):cation symporter [Eubacteriales bacterium]|nr:glycoside-pentoside-hexuronide (GPH):cation symporter [Eubacteriales bacterium]
MTQKLTKKEILCYGVGDFACNGCFVLVSSFLMYFYTDVAKLELAAVGMIILISRTVDAVSCLGMGGIIDRTDTRWGRARPYLAAFILPLCAALIALFYMPDLSIRGKLLYGLVTSVVYSVLYSGLSVSYSTMMTCMTQDSQERLWFNLAKNVSSNLGAFFVTSMTLFLVGYFGKGDAEKGFVQTMCVYGILYTGIMLVCFCNTKERVNPEQQRISLGESMKVAAKNRHWILLCVIEYLMLLGMTMRNQGTMYYAKYCLEQEAMGTVLLSVSTFLAIPMVFAVTFLAQKAGKKKSMCIGEILLAAGAAGMWFAGKNTAAMMFFHVIASIGNGIASGMVFVMIAEVVDYSEYQTGKRPQGFLTSAVSLMMKLGAASAGLLSAKVLEYGNYAVDAPLSGETLGAICANYIWIPVIVAVASIFIIQFYTLDEEYPQVLETLSDRKKSDEANIGG